MFAVIRHYHFNPKDGGEIDRRIREDFVPIVKKAKGFVWYYRLDTGKGATVFSWLAKKKDFGAVGSRG
jgi:hypothetical protein